MDGLDRAVAELRAAGLPVLGPRTYPDEVVLEGCRWKEAFVHPQDAFGVLLFLGEQSEAWVASTSSATPFPRGTAEECTYTWKDAGCAEGGLD